MTGFYDTVNFSMIKYPKQVLEHVSKTHLISIQSKSEMYERCLSAQAPVWVNENVTFLMVCCFDEWKLKNDSFVY